MNNTITIALIGLSGIIVGAVIQIAGNVIKHYLEQRVKDRTDEKRKQLLTTMLKDQRFPWCNLKTLRHVIGADEETTKRLLLEIGARGSEETHKTFGA
jgi:hypothetical protein